MSSASCSPAFFFPGLPLPRLCPVSSRATVPVVVHASSVAFFFFVGYLSMSCFLTSCCPVLLRRKPVAEEPPAALGPCSGSSCPGRSRSLVLQLGRFHHHASQTACASSCFFCKRWSKLEPACFASIQCANKARELATSPAGTRTKQTI